MGASLLALTLFGIELTLPMLLGIGLGVIALVLVVIIIIVVAGSPVVKAGLKQLKNKIDEARAAKTVKVEAR